MLYPEIGKNSTFLILNLEYHASHPPRIVPVVRIIYTYLRRSGMVSEGGENPGFFCKNTGCVDVEYAGYTSGPYCFECDKYKAINGVLPTETILHSLRRRLGRKMYDMYCTLNAWYYKPGWWWHWSSWAPCAGCGEMIHPWLHNCQLGSDCDGMGGEIPYCDQCNANLNLDLNDPLPGYNVDDPYIPWRGANPEQDAKDDARVAAEIRAERVAA